MEGLRFSRVASALQVQYSFPLGSAPSSRYLDVQYWDGQALLPVTQLELMAVAAPGTVDAAYTTASGAGLQGSVAGQSGQAPLLLS